MKIQRPPERINKTGENVTTPVEKCSLGTRHLWVETRLCSSIDTDVTCSCFHLYIYIYSNSKHSSKYIYASLSVNIVSNVGRVMFWAICSESFRGELGNDIKVNWEVFQIPFYGGIERAWFEIYRFGAICTFLDCFVLYRYFWSW